MTTLLTPAPSTRKSRYRREEDLATPTGREAAAVRLAQKYLTQLGLRPGPIDGLWGNRTQAAFERLRGPGAAANRSRINQLAQEYLADLGYDPGVSDGYWGPRTEAAYQLWRQGMPPAPAPAPADGAGDTPRVIAASPWPRDTEAALTDFYGPAGNVPLVMCQPCYPLRLSWEPNTVVRQFACHAKVRASLERVFAGIYAHYGQDLQRVRAARMDLFSGCYNSRPRTGNLARPSLHARGAAIDLDAAHNQFRWGRERASMPEEIIDLFAAEGWLSGGRAWGYDFMHFQATCGG